jgi:hypothetical protein
MVRFQVEQRARWDEATPRPKIAVTVRRQKTG